MDELTIGMTKEITASADESRLAVNVGSGTLRVLATPALAAFMEQAAWQLLQPYLSDDITTVGTNINIDHLRATPCGADIKVIAKLTAAEGRKYDFELEAYDKAGIIAKGKHTRFSVKAQRFMEKAEAT